MKFLHISTGDTKGAFSGAYRLHRNLIDCGHESFMFVGNKTTDDPTVLAPRKIFQSMRFALEKIFSLISKKIFGLEVQVSRIFKANLGFIPTAEVLKNIRNVKPDLVIIYYVADFLSERQLYEIKKSTNSPVAFYLMDMGMLTGSCHYAWDCTGYKSGCSDCPMTSSSIIKRNISAKWKSRKHHYQAVNPVIVSGSEQLSKQAEQSGLTKYLEQTKILMGVNSDVYSPANREVAREFFSFTDNHIVLYFGAQSVNDRRKGFTYFLEALKILPEMISPEVLSRILLFTIGAGNPIKDHNLPFKHIHLPFISDQNKFSKTYAAADAFVCTSVEDSGPMMVNESLMSGTPIISFDVGVAKDLVIPEKTGYKVPTINSYELAAALANFVKLPDAKRAEMRTNCRELAMQVCSMERQVLSFQDLAARLAST